MTPAPHSLADALKALAVGELDAMTPEQVRLAEAALNRDERLAAAFAGEQPRVEPRLAATLNELDRGAQPTPADWERVWVSIDVVAARRGPTDAGVARRILRAWRPLMAAAACLLLVLGWRVTQPAAVDSWPLQLAAEVEIDNLEVFQGATSFVVAVGGDNGGEIIWVLPAGSNL